MTPFADADEVFAYLESFTNLERGGFVPREYRLERMARLLDEFGDPQLGYKVIHVAGSKGKGSVCAFAANCCAASGARVGLYMSPHISDYRERISLLGDGMTGDQRDALVVEVGNKLANFVDRLRTTETEEKLPTTFERLTLLAFLIFREAGCEVAVIEVGLGGRLDATNLVVPAVSVITRIELEHTDYLGDTPQAIAREKGGIIKAGIPVVVADQDEEVAIVLKEIAKKQSAPLILARSAVAVRIGDTSDTGTDVTLKFSDDFEVGSRLALLGDIQANNAAVGAVAVRLALPDVSAEALSTGLAQTWIPGRAEIWPGAPRILLDGAHTPRSIGTVLQVAGQLEREKSRRVLVFGAVTGKHHEAILEALVDQFVEIIIARPGTFKESDTTALEELCRSLGGNCRRIDEMKPALAEARSRARVLNASLIVVTGSFYLVGEARQVLRTQE